MLKRTRLRTNENFLKSNEENPDVLGCVCCQAAVRSLFTAQCWGNKLKLQVPWIQFTTA